MEERSKTILLRRLEQAKTRNDSLKTLLEAVQTNLNNMRRLSKSAKENKNDPHNSSVVSLQKNLNKLELDNEKLIQRLNEAIASNNKLKEAVNDARNERIIHSGIFKNLEKEVRQHETIYKELLIERRVDQHNSEALEASHLKQKLAIQRRLEEGRETSRRVETCSRGSQEAETMKSTRKQPQKPRTAFLKKKPEDRKEIDRNAENARELQASYEHILASIKALGLGDLTDIELQQQQIAYETDQIYEANCELNSHIHRLEGELKKKLLSASMKQSNCKDEVTATQQASKHTHHLQSTIAAELAAVKEMEHRLELIGSQLKIGSATDQHDLCRQIEEKLGSQQAVKSAVESEEEDVEHEQENGFPLHPQPKQNRLNLLLSKSRQLREFDHILSTTQFKHAFREIQNKPTLHLRE